MLSKLFLMLKNTMQNWLEIKQDLKPKKRSNKKYNHQKKERYLYKSSLPEYRLSRSRLENFLKCKRCFYLDRKLGVDKPQSYPFRLNSAVDELLKKEFDLYRERRQIHPYCL